MQIRTPDQRLRVFISSTLAELARERAVVARAVSKLGLTPVLFERGARPHPPSLCARIGGAMEARGSIRVLRGEGWRVSRRRVERMRAAGTNRFGPPKGVRPARPGSLMSAWISPAGVDTEIRLRIFAPGRCSVAHERLVR
jgi:hypothetical protein